MNTNIKAVLVVSEKDFENASEFHDVCPQCNEASDDYKYLLKNDKEYFMCPKCGHINN